MAAQNSRRKKYFDFDLLPSISRSDMRVLKDRDDSTLYAFVLVFSAVFIFFILNLIQIVIVEARINVIQDNIDEAVEDIDSYNDIRAIHGEIFQKATLLKTALEKDIRITDLFDISSDLTSGIGDILTYQRLVTGDFSITVDLADVEDIDVILGRAREHEEIIDPYITNVSANETRDRLRVALTFNLHNPDE
jgi:hypothetical protein